MTPLSDNLLYGSHSFTCTLLSLLFFQTDVRNRPTDQLPKNSCCKSPLLENMLKWKNTTTCIAFSTHWIVVWNRPRTQPGEAMKPWFPQLCTSHLVGKWLKENLYENQMNFEIRSYFVLITTDNDFSLECSWHFWGDLSFPFQNEASIYLEVHVHFPLEN